MNSRAFIVIPLLLCCATAFAQTATDSSKATYHTPEGEVVVHSGQPAARGAGPAPSFAQLAHANGYISSADADAYPPLANDFIYADSNRDGRISKAEYQRWAASR
jgi:hypothetical protein